MKFTVDAGIINRLGVELVGKSETALAELIKNAYDADARKVSLEFVNKAGESFLIIDDNGLGMTKEQLENGFMRLSSTEKVHEPFSPRYQRTRAGKKGIGRFAAHRLGWELIIITQTLSSKHALKLTINWSDYKIDTNLMDIENDISIIPKTKPEGTTLIINRLRDNWSETQIKAVYRHSASILQPDFLADRISKDVLVDNTFKIEFILNENDIATTIVDDKTMIFNNALATIEGVVNNDGKGSCNVYSKALGIDESDIEVRKRFLNLRNINFKTYYFIYDREIYYRDNISKIQLRGIKEMAKTSSGIKVYRNGFRVSPYGDLGNDWLKLDKTYTFIKSGVTNIPLGNRNFFGFVEILDSDGRQFEETASREGLIENESFRELVDFLNDSLQLAKLKIGEKVYKIRETEIKENQDITKSFQDQISYLEENVGKITIEILEKNSDPILKERVLKFNNNFYTLVADLKSRYSSLLEEQGMLRVLSGMGLQIGEFSHEIVHYLPAINGDLFRLKILSDQNPEILEIINSLAQNFNQFKSYTSYFNTTISQNSQRELVPILVSEIVGDFVKTIKSNAERLYIDLNVEVRGSNLYTIPMHPSEWSSILFNFYTNSKKAINKTNDQGKIKIIIGANDSSIYLDFLDNGIGIKSEHEGRIFDAFFSTSSPSQFGDELNNEYTGTGLGLKIVKDIIDTYDGRIYITTAEKGFVTAIRVEIPSASKDQINEYAL